MKDKLTPEQRECPTCGGYLNIFCDDEKFEAWIECSTPNCPYNKDLSANTAEDEQFHGELDGYVHPYCECKYCVHGRTQITMRKIEEYKQTKEYREMSTHGYGLDSPNFLTAFYNWLQQEDK